MTDKERAWVAEVVKDSRAHPSRLSAWENNFIAGIARGLNTLGIDAVLSEKQMDILKRIERKVYAT